MLLTGSRILAEVRSLIVVTSMSIGWLSNGCSELAVKTPFREQKTRSRVCSQGIKDFSQDAQDDTSSFK